MPCAPRHQERKGLHGDGRAPDAGTFFVSQRVAEPPVTDTALPPLRAGLGTVAISRRVTRLPPGAVEASPGLLMLKGFYRPPTTDQVGVDFFNRGLLPASGLATSDRTSRSHGLPPPALPCDPSRPLRGAPDRAYYECR